jgi:Transposase, Mutator family
VTTAAGAIPVREPRVNDKRVDEATGERKQFGSAILPAWARKSPRVAEVLPLLYLHGLSSSDFAPALTQFHGTSHGLSAATITRLTKDWQDEATVFNKRSLADSPTSSTRSPSPHSPARRPRWPRSGTPKTASTPRPLPAPSWPSTAPSGPSGREAHRRPRRAAGVLLLPRRALGPPAYHEPDRVDLRHRPPSARVTKGPGSRAAGVAMAFKLIESAQQRWRAVNAPHLVVLVRAGARFEKGLLVERPDESGGDQQVA